MNEKTDTRNVLNDKARKQKSLDGYLVIFSVTLIVIGLYFLIQRFTLINGVEENPQRNEIIREDTSEPSEKRPRNTYVVPADQPRKISIDAIGVSGYIQQVGINSKNAISVPNNIHMAGWFVDSVRPGEKGLSIIDGHVSGRYNDAIFKDLALLKAGDIITIEFGDSSTRDFEVKRLTKKPESEAAQTLLQKDNEIGEQLNLITCGGNYSVKRQTFLDRIIVVSSRVR